MGLLQPGVASEPFELPLWQRRPHGPLTAKAGDNGAELKRQNGVSKDENQIAGGEKNTQ